VAEPLLAASAIIAGTKMAAVLPLTFLRRGSKWLRQGSNTGECRIVR